MWVENEGSKAQGECGEPEVDQMGYPKRHRHVQQHDQSAHPQVDTRTREARIQDRKRHACRSEATTSRNVPGTTECKITQDRVAVDLR